MNKTETLYTGTKGIEQLTGVQRTLFARRISRALTRHPDTMGQRTPEEIITSMEQGRSVVIADGEQIRAYTDVSNQTDEEGKIIADEMICRTWVTFDRGNGYGATVMKHAAALAREHGAKKVVTNINVANDDANNVIKKMGQTREIRFAGVKPSQYIKDALVNVYDVTNLGQQETLLPAYI